MTEFGVVKGVIDGLGETNMKNKINQLGLIE